MQQFDVLGQVLPMVSLLERVRAGKREEKRREDMDAFARQEAAANLISRFAQIARPVVGGQVSIDPQERTITQAVSAAPFGDIFGSTRAANPGLTATVPGTGQQFEMMTNEDLTRLQLEQARMAERVKNEERLDYDQKSLNLPINIGEVEGLPGLTSVPRAFMPVVDNLLNVAAQERRLRETKAFEGEQKDKDRASREKIAGENRAAQDKRAAAANATRLAAAGIAHGSPQSNAALGRLEQERKIQELASRAIADSTRGGGTSIEDAIRNVTQFYQNDPAMSQNRAAVIEALQGLTKKKDPNAALLEFLGGGAPAAQPAAAAPQPSKAAIDEYNNFKLKRKR